jgi:hypothetical protein
MQGSDERKRDKLSGVKKKHQKEIKQLERNRKRRVLGNEVSISQIGHPQKKIPTLIFFFFRIKVSMKTYIRYIRKQKNNNNKENGPKDMGDETDGG